jgi:glycerophosphoryl diester phosphodiesterase
MLTQLPRPVIFAHRGSSAHAPENTLAAFELALRQNADAIELDAKLSKDNQVVVIHDQTVDRTTEGSGAVNSLTLQELRKLDAGSHFDIAFRGEPIPTLEEVLKAVGQMTFINIELTNYSSPGDQLPDRVAALVRKYKVSRRVLFSSFDPRALIRIRRLIPEAPIGLLAQKGRSGTLARSWLGRLLKYQSMHPDQADASPNMVRSLHQHGKYLFSYTVNLEEDIRRLFELGVDGIFTDDPVRARQVLAHTVLVDNKR